MHAVAAALLAAVTLACGAREVAPAPPRAPAPAAAPAPPPEPALAALVLSAGDDVERTRAGEWARALAGDALAVADSIRTGRASTAEVQLGRGARVTVSPRTEVTVRELTAAVQRIGLLRGRVAVDVERDGTRVVRVEDASGALRVTSSGGRIGVVAAPDSLAIVAEDGGATLESAGGAVEVPPGHQSAAWLGRAPVAPAPIPRALLMRVVEAVEARSAGVCDVVRVDVAAEVLVDGAPVKTPADGRLVLRAPPRGRRRHVELVVRHAGGKVDRRTVPCGDDADVSDLEVRWDDR
jgi:hypothetical protein